MASPSSPLLRTVLVGLGAFVWGCSARPAPEDRAYIAPDGEHWAHLETLPADPAQERLLPSQRLVLMEAAGGRGPTLLEGLETLCGTELIWDDSSHLRLRLPADRAKFVRLANGQQWSGVSFSLQLHEDLVTQRVWSPDQQRCLVVVQNCETEDWNLYLRKPGEPTYNDAMEQGWEDATLFGGFNFQQRPAYLKWTGPRSAEIGIPDKRYDVTVRDKVDDVTMKWVFLKKFRHKEAEVNTLAPLPTASK